ncbi:hypothetical protein TWF696_004156 [Orbilia brochopaga]|uniref:Uncharacterized protein n=1 Tax=Orbilia brochopaga TaxID=3140254 RepID=A0AAV9V7N9_9PEZI
MPTTNSSLAFDAYHIPMKRFLRVLLLQYNLNSSQRPGPRSTCICRARQHEQVDRIPRYPPRRWPVNCISHLSREWINIPTGVAGRQLLPTGFRQLPARQPAEALTNE